MRLAMRPPATIHGAESALRPWNGRPVTGRASVTRVPADGVRQVALEAAACFGAGSWLWGSAAVLPEGRVCSADRSSVPEDDHSGDDQAERRGLPPSPGR